MSLLVFCIDKKYSEFDLICRMSDLNTVNFTFPYFELNYAKNKSSSKNTNSF